MEKYLRADIHTHTKYSGFTKYSIAQFPDSISEPNMVVKVAKSRGINVLCITDHNCIKGAIKAKESAIPGIDIVIGEEILTSEGEIIGLFLQERIEPNLGAEDTIDLIREQDGIVIAPHPFSPHCPCLGSKVKYLDIDGIEVFNAIHRDPYSNKLASRKDIILDKAIIGSSDAHTIEMVGNGYTTFNAGNSNDGINDGMDEYLRTSILKKQTFFGGEITSLAACIRWSIGSALEISKASYKTLRGDFDKDDVLHARINRIKKRNKVLGLLSGAIYVTPPVPIISGLIGELVMRRKAKRIWEENRCL